MFGTAISLTTARILHYASANDSDFEIAKLLAVRADFLQTIKRLGNLDLYKSYQEKAQNIVSKEELLAEIDKLSQTLKGKGLETKKIDMYADYAKRTLEATKESCAKTNNHLVQDIDMLTPVREGKMYSNVQKCDNNGNVIPLFQKDENGKYKTYADDRGTVRYAINDDVFDWSDTKSFYKFAKMYDKKIHGHAIVWHDAVPFQIKELAKSDLPAAEKKKMTQDFLYGYMRSYADVAKQSGVNLESLDVLNEIANDDENSKDYLRQSEWRELMGDGYYIDVLKMAKQIFPGTKLMYNDYSEFHDSKRSNMLKVIKNIQKAEKTEGSQLLDCVGLQCHLYGEELDYGKAFKEFNDATKSGPFSQEVRVTELDSSPCGNEEWQQKQMEEVVKAADENGVKNVTCWEFAGQFSDSIEKSDNSGVIDKKGNATNTYNKIAESHSDSRVNASAVEYAQSSH